ncbi:hypothetical protein N7537_010660, partial [Penicillium hordei]
GGGHSSHLHLHSSPAHFFSPRPCTLIFFSYLVLGVLEFAGLVWDDCRPIIRASVGLTLKAPDPLENRPPRPLACALSDPSDSARKLRHYSIGHPHVSLHGVRTLNRTRPAYLQFPANL